MRSSDRLLSTALVLFLALAPETARAHASLDGAEGFYFGLLHPLTSPGQVLALLALGLLLAQHRMGAVQREWVVFSVTLLVGLAAGVALDTTLPTEVALLVVAVTAASAVAIARALPRPVRIVLACAVGLLIGVASRPETGSVQAMLVTATGSLLGANALLLYVLGGISWLLERFGRPWLHIAVRIVASWIGAVACLMVAVNLAGSSSNATPTTGGSKNSDSGHHRSQQRPRSSDGAWHQFVSREPDAVRASW